MISEAIIRKLTLETPNGGSCRIGDDAFTVRYCSDIWEWEFQGETYWDVLDLAEAMDRRSSLVRPKPHASPMKAKTRRRLTKTRHPLDAVSVGS